MPVPVGFADCSIHFLRTGDPEEMVITFGVEIVDPSSHDGVATKIALSWRNEFDNANIPHIIQSVKAVARIGEEGGEETVQEATIAQLGGDNRELLPQNCAMLIRKVTSFGGRQNQGRWFLPWAFEAEVDNVGMLDVGSATKYTTSAQAFLTEMNNSTGVGPLPPVILHRRNKAGTIHAPTAITGLVCEQLLATQRHRMRK